jgi:hypothetical protein
MRPLTFGPLTFGPLTPPSPLWGEGRMRVGREQT